MTKFSNGLNIENWYFNENCKIAKLQIGGEGMK
jgi:hypothetical protein